MYKRKLVTFSALVFNRGGAVTIAPYTMLISTKARATAATVKRYLPEGYQLIEGSASKGVDVTITGYATSHAPLSLFALVGELGKGWIEFD